MQEGGGKPGCGACRQCRCQGLAAPEAEQGRSKKKNCRHNSPEDTSGVLDHKPGIPRLVGIEPEEHCKGRDRHGCDETGKARGLPPELRAPDDDQVGNYELYSKWHGTRQYSVIGEWRQRVKDFDKQSGFRYCSSMQEFLTSHGYPALFIVSFLASTLLPLGSEWLLVALLLKGFSPLPVVAVASVGNFLGACTSYYIGIYGSLFFTEKIFRLSKSDRERAERAFVRYGCWSLLFTWLPVIGDPLCVVAGMLRMAFLPFTVMVMAGKSGRYAVLAWATLAGKSLFV